MIKTNLPPYFILPRNIKINSVLKILIQNKFMEYLPEEVRGSLKMDLIFDKEGLLESTEDKTLYFIDSSMFRKSIFKLKQDQELDFDEEE